MGPRIGPSTLRDRHEIRRDGRERILHRLDESQRDIEHMFLVAPLVLVEPVTIVVCRKLLEKIDRFLSDSDRKIHLLPNKVMINNFIRICIGI